MTNNSSLHRAKAEKNDEFYTQISDIEKEINSYYEYDRNFLWEKTVLCPCDSPKRSNFPKFLIMHAQKYGIKKVISTSYNINSPKNNNALMQMIPLTWGYKNFPGEILIWEKKYDPYIISPEEYDSFCNKKYSHLHGNGDFRSEEIKIYRDEADIIITNPPFSLYREFITWLGGKKFIIIGNMNSITYKEIFSKIQKGELWIGASGFTDNMIFEVPPDVEIPNAYKKKAEKMGFKGNFTRMGNSCWFTNMEYSQRHSPLVLNTMNENLSKNKKIKALGGYIKYENSPAIEVPETNAIPSDYPDVMGVPISFLGKFCPEQFEIVSFRKGDDGKDLYYIINNEKRYPYFRILIRHKC